MADLDLCDGARDDRLHCDDSPRLIYRGELLCAVHHAAILDDERRNHGENPGETA